MTPFVGKVVFGMVAAGAALLAAQGLRTNPDHCLAEFTTSLDGRQRDQVHNAHLAANKLNGALVEPGEALSFNQTVGSWTRDAGFRRAPTAYNGTLIDQWGGGVCQTSTTLYNAALLAGLEILERHPHRFAPSYIEPGRDAAVAFSGVDLRVRNPYRVPLRVRAFVDGNRVHVGFYGAVDVKERPRIVREVKNRVKPQDIAIDRIGSVSRVRNSGKAGWQVSVFRVTGDRWEELSKDDYPVMDRLIER